ncbi:E3 ubiquitin-protein ligase SINA-like 10 [Cardamine amara subsp. amara]|uniref:RING-type E3 ubiquitin transferase n=1 Tax=Cardamine amara subsp. amara TaxID=228776 RepID=A0ABD1AJT1_CARAN
MFMNVILFFFAYFRLIIHILCVRDGLRNQRLVRQPSLQENAKTEETGEAEIINSFLSLTLLDPDVLECPTCCEPLKIPIFQCDNGHLACSLCCQKVNNICPSCKLPIGYNRCRAIEKVIEASRVSCPNAKYGCQEKTAFGNPFKHEKQCCFTPCSCPISDCNYIGLSKDLINHVCAKHKNDLNLFVWDTPLIIDCKKITLLQEEKDGEVVVVQVFSSSRGLTLTVSCISPLTSKLGRFSCSLKFATSTIRLKQTLMLKEIQKVSDEHPGEGFMFIPSYMLPSTGNLQMGICISRGQDHILHA